ncbi:MAG TPA: class I SAM-dependent methyltransferase [Candidatus Polarisedimenticolaceae bacterium]|nr:class I SAM-dependent methyltransferase [Candidatus Polarisedimenticolaceae bacterium]
MHGPSRSESDVHAPHAPLTEYYADEKQRRGFVSDLFDETAGDYDRIERMMALGTGPWYRRRALLRSGLVPGMEVLDVATGTGLVAAQAAAITGRSVVGVDPSFGMLRSGSRPNEIVAVRAAAERLPLPSDRFDFLSMGFALRHMSDLAAVFAEFHRVIRPGGTVCVLEITRPESALGLRALKTYMRLVIPALARVVGRHRDTPKLYRYFWDTIEACVPPQAVMATLTQAGFADVKRTVEIGIFSEYTGRKA